MRGRCTRAACASLLIGALAGCSAPVGPDGRPVVDPHEAGNRSIFGFNEGVDYYVLNPLAEGWSTITFLDLRLSLNKFFYNLEFLVRCLSNLGQGEGKQAGVEVVRFLTNTTVGLLGFFDPASRLGLQRSDEDFGQMFAVWGMDGDPYWVLPFLGPSNPRDTLGFVFDSIFDLMLVFGLPIEIVNTRALRDREIEAARRSALDFYVFVRDAYLQRREAQVQNRKLREELDDETQGPGDDFYELEENDSESVP